MNYKKIIKNQEVRLKILKILEFIPDKIMIKLQYRIKTGKRLNLDNPKRFNEKLQWYKLNYRNELMTQCVDKHLVREYVKNKGYEDILIPQYGVYKSTEEINFEKLPLKFILKTNNGSHTNIICRDKKQLDLKEVSKKLNRWLKNRSSKLGREWAYYNVSPLIICEELLEDKLDPTSEIKDYKFICFNGKVEYIWVDTNRYTSHHRNFFDKDWNMHYVETDVPMSSKKIEKPKKLKEMIEIASTLSKDFPHVRVDLYFINEKIYFGELTFYLLSGYEKFTPDDFDYELGKKFLITENKK